MRPRIKVAADGSYSQSKALPCKSGSVRRSAASSSGRIGFLRVSMLHNMLAIYSREVNTEQNREQVVNAQAQRTRAGKYLDSKLREIPYKAIKRLPHSSLPSARCLPSHISHLSRPRLGLPLAMLAMAHRRPTIKLQKYLSVSQTISAMQCSESFAKIKCQDIQSLAPPSAVLLPVDPSVIVRRRAST